MTITLDQDVYDGLSRMVGKRRVSQFISDVVRPHVSDKALDDGYREMAVDTRRETDAAQWVDSLANDGIDGSR